MSKSEHELSHERLAGVVAALVLWGIVITVALAVLIAVQVTG